MSNWAVMNKLAAVSILLGLIAGVALIAWPVAQRYSANAQEIETLRHSLGRFNSIAKYKSQLDEDRSGTQPAFVKNWFLEQAPPAIVTAKLQSRLKTIAGTNGAQIIATNDIKRRRQDNLTFLGVRVSMVGSLSAIHKTLRSIETGVPYLFVDSASFRADPIADRAATLDAQLELVLEIYGVQATLDDLANNGGGS